MVVPPRVAAQMPAGPKKATVRISLPPKTPAVQFIPRPEMVDSGAEVNIPMIPEDTSLIDTVNRAIEMCLLAGYRDMMFVFCNKCSVVVSGLSEASFDWIPVASIVPRMSTSVAVRLKAMANMSIAEHRRPMFGKVEMPVGPQFQGVKLGAYFLPRGGGHYEFYLSRSPG